MPPETRTSLISLSGSIVVHSFLTLPRPGGFGTEFELCRADFQNSPNESSGSGLPNRNETFSATFSTYTFTKTVYALTTSADVRMWTHVEKSILLIHLPKRWHASFGGLVPPLIPAPFDGSSFRSCSLFRLTGADSAVFALIYALISAMWSLVIHMAPKREFTPAVTRIVRPGKRSLASPAQGPYRASPAQGPYRVSCCAARGDVSPLPRRGAAQRAPPRSRR